MKKKQFFSERGEKKYKFRGMACLNNSPHDYSALDKDMKVILCASCGDMKKTPFWTETKSFALDFATVFGSCHAAQKSGTIHYAIGFGVFPEVEREIGLFQTFVAALGWNYSQEPGCHVITFPKEKNKFEEIVKEAIEVLKNDLIYEIPFTKYTDIRPGTSELEDLCHKEDLVYTYCSRRKTHIIMKKPEK